MRIHLKLRGSSSCAILCAIVVILGACSFQINCKTFIIISYNLYYLCKGLRLETRGYVIALYVHLILEIRKKLSSLVIYKYNTFQNRPYSTVLLRSVAIGNLIRNNLVIICQTYSILHRERRIGRLF